MTRPPRIVAPPIATHFMVFASDEIAPVVSFTAPVTPPCWNEVPTSWPSPIGLKRSVGSKPASCGHVTSHAPQRGQHAERETVSQFGQRMTVDYLTLGCPSRRSSHRGVPRVRV